MRCSCPTMKRAFPLLHFSVVLLQMFKKENNKSQSESSGIILSDNDLLAFIILGIVFSIVFTYNAIDKLGDSGMPGLINILLNIGCSVLASLAMSIFIYYKYLKRIPGENEKRINAILSQSGGVLTKSADHSTEDTYTIRDFKTAYENAESGLHFITTFQLEIPMRIGKDVLPPIRVPMKVDSTYNAKF